MKRTTLALDDELLRRLKERAGREGQTMQSLARDLLRQALARSGNREFKLHLKGWAAQPQAGVDILDRDKLFDLMEGR